MKQISARKFRLSFPKITEPVTVVTLDGEEVRTLGTWTPQSRALTSENIVERVAGFGSPSPAPKTRGKK